MIYRGQKYGDPVGEWWTSSAPDAERFAMSAGSNRSWVVLSLDEDDETWLGQFLTYPEAGSFRASWYRIPLDRLKDRWRGVRIYTGQLALDNPGQIAIINL